MVAPKICEKDIRWFTIKAKGLDILTKKYKIGGLCVYIYNQRKILPLLFAIALNSEKEPQLSHIERVIRREIQNRNYESLYKSDSRNEAITFAMERAIEKSSLSQFWKN